VSPGVIGLMNQFRENWISRFLQLEYQFTDYWGEKKMCFYGEKTKSIETKLDISGTEFNKKSKR
jgi:hypothetical protein